MRLTRAARSGLRRAGVGAIVAGLVGASLGAGCGVEDGVVGGGCAAGYMDCNNQCILVTNDPDNCGACGNVCASGHCAAGMCSALGDGGRKDAGEDAHHDAKADGMTRDGSSPDGSDGAHRDALAEGSNPEGSTGDAPSTDSPTSDHSTSDSPGTDGTVPDGSAPDGTSPDGSSTDGAPRDSGTDQCAPPYITPDQCGACGTLCPEGDFCSPNIATDGGGPYVCAPMCPAPYVACGGTCIDVSGDPGNCGACGRVCPSGICTNKICEGVTAGDIVVIGHDYATSAVLVSEAEILANAVFLPPSNPLRVLSYEQFADASQVTHVKSTLATYAPFGRTIQYTVVTSDTTLAGELNLSSFDALLVYDQVAAPAGMLGPVGAELAMPIANFVAIGGDVVVLDGASGTKEMGAFLTQSGLLAVQGETPVPPADKLFVVASGDAVGNFVISPYAPIPNSIYFTTTEVNGGKVTYIVDDFTLGGPMPVVIHKTP